MIKRNETYLKWINAAYQEFAMSGPDFSLKSLSNEWNLPRSNFYYHFDNKEHLMSELLSYHSNECEKFQTELKKNIKTLIPDLYIIMFLYKTSVMFHQQLLRNCHIEMYSSPYYSINNSSIKILLPQIKVYFKTNHSDLEIIKFYNTLTDAWYSQLNFTNLSVDSMINLAENIMENTLGLYNNPNFLKNSKL